MFLPFKPKYPLNFYIHRRLLYVKQNVTFLPSLKKNCFGCNLLQSYLLLKNERGEHAMGLKEWDKNKMAPPPLHCKEPKGSSDMVFLRLCPNTRPSFAEGGSSSFSIRVTGKRNHPGPAGVSCKSQNVRASLPMILIHPLSWYYVMSTSTTSRSLITDSRLLVVRVVPVVKPQSLLNTF